MVSLENHCGVREEQHVVFAQRQGFLEMAVGADFDSALKFWFA
jgi:hypothetical protein